MSADVNKPGDLNITHNNDSTLTLFIPDLLGLQPFLSQLSKTEQPLLPVLEKWLTRGQRETAEPQDEVIFSELGITSGASSNKPISAFSLLAESTMLGMNEQAYWLRADPVYIQPDRDTIVLMEHDELGLSVAEAEKLVEEINTHFADEPWELYAVDPQRWYVKLENSHDLITTPLAKVVGQDINQFMPRGEHAPYWSQCINEIQMLLHGSQVNFERETRGMWTINSLWLWGGGVLPGNKNLNSLYTKIISNNSVLQGIARYYGLEHFPLSQIEKPLQTGTTFMLLDSLSESVTRQDVYSYVQNLVEIESSYLARIDALLKQRKLNKVRLLSDNLTVTLTSKHLRRWWKRQKAFSEL